MDVHLDLRDTRVLSGGHYAASPYGPWEGLRAQVCFFQPASRVELERDPGVMVKVEAENPSV